MTALWRRIVLAMIVMALATGILALVWRPLGEAARFHVPDPQEAAAAQALFRRALAEPGGAAVLREPAAELGLVATGLGGAAGLALTELPDDCAGRGAYLLRPASGPAVSVTAPHRGSDLLTGTLARQLFDETRVAAAAWNTAPRRPLADCPAAGDVARAETHYLTAFSLGFAQAYPAGRVVQLHGFDAEKYLSLEGYVWDAVLSNGTRRASSGLQDVAACLRAAFPGRRIAVFPKDIGELGATSNAQGQAMRAAGFDGFVHLELSLTLRQQLAGSKADRARLAVCLEAGL